MRAVARANATMKAMSKSKIVATSVALFAAFAAFASFAGLGGLRFVPVALAASGAAAGAAAPGAAEAAADVPAVSGDPAAAVVPGAVQAAVDVPIVSGDAATAAAAGVVPVSVEARTAPPDPAAQAAWVEWENQVAWAHAGGAYPRLLRLENGDLLLAFDDLNRATGKTEQKVIRSTDGGATWRRPVTVAAHPGFDYANGQMIQRPDGAVLIAYREVSATSRTLKVSVSTDGGNEWEFLSEIASHPNGVWEPHMIVLPGGEIQVYYASEAYQPRWPQVIEMKRSLDGGATWGEPTVVSYAAGSRDGMPVAEVLDNGEIFVVFEAEQPFVVKSVRSADRGRTWGPRTLVYQGPSVAAAPYVVQMPGGDLVVSFQSTIGGVLRMETVVSRDRGATWGPATTGNVPGVWNALFVLGPDTLLGASSGVVLRTGRIVPAAGPPDSRASVPTGGVSSPERPEQQPQDAAPAASEGRAAAVPAAGYAPGVSAPTARLTWGGWALNGPGPVASRGRATVYLGADVDEAELARVLVELAPVSTRSSPSVLVYDGPAYPEDLGVDTSAFDDGPYDVKVRVETTGGAVIERDFRVVFDNWIELVDELLPPLESPWFGTVKRRNTFAESSGWLSVGDRPEAFGGDDSRLVRRGDSPEFLVWEAPGLRRFEVTLYSRSEADLGAVSFAVSGDGEGWTPVRFEAHAAFGSGGEWIEFTLAGGVEGGILAESDASDEGAGAGAGAGANGVAGVDGGAAWGDGPGVRYLRLIVSGGTEPDAVQLGRVVIYSAAV